MKKIKILLIILALIVVVPACYGQQTKKTKTVEGYVAQVDEVGSTIVVTISTDEIPFFVPDDAKITRGAETISIEDIEIADSLMIEYFINESGQNEVVSIIDNNLANE